MITYPLQIYWTGKKKSSKHSIMFNIPMSNYLLSRLCVVCNGYGSHWLNTMCNGPSDEQPQLSCDIKAY